MCAPRGRVPRALLLFARRRGNPVGDTAAAARNYACLRAAFGEIAMSVWSPDAALWSALCGTEVGYVPFPGDCIALDDVDLIVADCVQLDVELTAALDASGAAVLDLAPGRDFRWRLPRGDWHTLSLPPDVDWSRRLIAVYGLLGARITDEQTLLPPPRRGTGIYVNPYASTAAKSLHPAFLRDVLAQLADAPDAVDVVCPAPPEHVEDGDRGAYAALDACVRQAARRGARITVLPPMSVAEYVERIRSAGAVIGSDSSSQHVAALFGTPSIACYPPHARGSYYRSPGWNNLCFTVPEADRTAELRSLAALVVTLARAFERGTIAQPRALPAATTLVRHAARGRAAERGRRARAAGDRRGVRRAARRAARAVACARAGRGAHARGRDHAARARRFCRRRRPRQRAARSRHGGQRHRRARRALRTFGRGAARLSGTRFRERASVSSRAPRRARARSAASTSAGRPSEVRRRSAPRARTPRPG